MMSTQSYREPTTKYQQDCQASACGKAIIVGEHSVVYGTRAVAMPLPNMRFVFRLRRLAPSIGSQEPQIQLKLGGQNLSPRVHAVVQQAMRLLELTPCNLLGQSESALPIGAGLGSSATLCVAVLRALADFAGRKLTALELARLANELEKSFHGNPSGLDAAVVAFEECILFRKGGPIEAISRNAEIGRPWRFVLVDSGLRASTLTMIQVAAPFFKGSEGERHLAAFDEISLQVYAALQQNNQASAGEAMQRCDSLLRAAGVVPSTMAQQIDSIRELGVLGVKSTGAGGGGMILALLDPEQSARQIQAVQNRFGASSCFAIEL